MRQDKRIGIVGGVGPHAGLDLTRKLFDHTRAETDQEHLPVMLYSFPDRIGERPAFLLGKTVDNPGEAIGDIMAELAEAVPSAQKIGRMEAYGGKKRIYLE